MKTIVLSALLSMVLSAASVDINESQNTTEIEFRFKVFLETNQTKKPILMKPTTLSMALKELNDLQKNKLYILRDNDANLPVMTNEVATIKDLAAILSKQGIKLKLEPLGDYTMVSIDQQ